VGLPSAAHFCNLLGQRRVVALAAFGRAMPKGFYWLVLAQFLSGLADNILLIVGIGLLLEQGYPPWWAALLKLTFTFSYVILAPWVGHVADAFVKRDLMAVMNGLKIVGASALLLGGQPLLSFAIVGLGASVYAPAKYGLVTETVTPRLLVRANGWLEVTVVMAVLLGVGTGGWLVSSAWADLWASWGLLAGLGLIHSGLDDVPLQGALLVVLCVYLASALANTGVMRRPLNPTKSVRLNAVKSRQFVRSFVQANRMLWSDAMGGLALAVTTIFWAASAVMQFAVIDWAQLVLGFALSQAAYLQVVVAVGVIVGAGVSAARIKISKSVVVLSLGVLLGIVVAFAALVKTVPWAVGLLLLVGAFGGAVVVPMNALLQYRGHRVLKPGISIAVQGFNENLAILVLLAAYVGLNRDGVGLIGLMVALGATLSIAMLFLMFKNWRWLRKAAGLT